MPPAGHPAPTLVESITLTHPEDELAWTAAGSVRIVAGGREWTVDAARALWIPGGVPHTVLPDADALLLPVFFPPESSSPGPSHAAVHPVPRTDELDALVRAALQRGLVAPSKLARARARLRVLAEGSSSEVPLPIDPRARRVAEALLHDPGRPETLEEWARHVHTSAKTLQRCFAAETGMRFPEWRSEVRLSHARKLLDGSDERVRAIAARVGYTSSAAFSDAFRRRYGNTPVRVRTPSR